MLYRITYRLHGRDCIEVGSYATIRALADWLARTFHIIPTIEKSSTVADRDARQGRNLDTEYDAPETYRICPSCNGDQPEDDFVGDVCRWCARGKENA